MDMKLDPILAEIRQVREAFANKFSGDVRAMMNDIRRRQGQSGHPVVSRPPKRIDQAPVAAAGRHQTGG
jgi:hypothetical protein